MEKREIVWKNASFSNSHECCYNSISTRTEKMFCIFIYNVKQRI